MLIALAWLADLLIVENWVATKKIVDPAPDNNGKWHLQLISRFDLEKFPFVIAGGKESINLINVKTQEMQVLIKTSTFLLANMGFCKLRPDGTFTFHFVNRETNAQDGIYTFYRKMYF